MIKTSPEIGNLSEKCKEHFGVWGQFGNLTLWNAVTVTYTDNGEGQKQDGECVVSPEMKLSIACETEETGLPRYKLVLFF